jgi:chromate transporter
MHRELVERHRWISEARFLHALNFCMLLPGPEAQQLATYIGWLQHGLRGAVAAGVLFVLPGFVLITAISMLYAYFHSLVPVQGILFGLRAAVLAIVLEAVIRIARRALKGAMSWFVAAAAFISIFAFAIPFPIIVAVAALVGFTAQRWGTTKSLAVAVGADSEQSVLIDRPVAPASTARIAVVCSFLWFAPLLLIYITLGPTHVLTQQGLFFSKMAVVTFGGAYAALAYVAQQAVERFGWLSPDDMLQGLALAETTPGPLILVLTFVGFTAAFRDALPFDPLWAGLFGAALTTWVTFVPCFLWILVGAPHVERMRHQKALSAALATVTAAVVGVILNLAIWFALHALFGEIDTWHGYILNVPVPRLGSLDFPALIIAISAILAMLRFKAPMLAVLGACAVAGLLITSLR